ncbi:hypothetical protein [Streptosporangium vulgare]|uniref:hypothetical protein n=1 Tax=Streptosporangium vulgare TaxID=46190 RepID=UPI0031DE449F
MIFRLCESDHVLAAGHTACDAHPGGHAGLRLRLLGDVRRGTPCRSPTPSGADRPSHTGLHFGYGPHLCLGRHLGTAIVPEVVQARHCCARGCARSPGRGRDPLRRSHPPRAGPPLTRPGAPRQAASW